MLGLFYFDFLLLKDTLHLYEFDMEMKSRVFGCIIDLGKYEFQNEKRCFVEIDSNDLQNANCKLQGF